MFYFGLACLGFFIGSLSGLFGVGGGFLLVPFLNSLFGVSYPIAVGSSLAQMVPTSTAASLRHHGYGNVDFKLGLFLLLISFFGTEMGARVLNWLKGTGEIVVLGRKFDKLYFFITLIYLVLLLLVGIFMFREGKKAQKEGRVSPPFTLWMERLRFPPRIFFPLSGRELSVWPLLILGFGIGFLVGLLGVGGGFIMVPSLIYLIGIPTTVAIGTSLFQIIFVSFYGAFTHFLKGNVDFLIVISLLSGSILGTQGGAWLTQKLKKAKLRYYFSFVVFGSIILILIKLFFPFG